MKSQVKQISNTLFEVLNHSVKIQTKKGRRILLCDCSNSTRFADSNLCFHKELVLEYLFKKPISDRLDKLIPLYQNWTKMKLPQNPELMLDDLINLRRKLWV